MTHRNYIAIMLALATMIGLPALADNQPVGTTFTYQGRLKQAGQPVGQPVNLTFRLFDVEVGGKSLAEADAPNFSGFDPHGVFTIDINFGADPTFFDGGERWLEVQVNETILTPRQPLHPTPYAMVATTAASVPEKAMVGTYGGITGVGKLDSLLVAGNVGVGTQNPTQKFHSLATSFFQGAAIYGQHTSPAGNVVGIWGESASEDGRGIFGRATSSTGVNTGVHGVSNSPDGRGIWGVHSSFSGTGAGVLGETNSQSPSAVGVHGVVRSPVAGELSAGVIGEHRGGQGTIGIGVRGHVSSGAAYAGYFTGGHCYFERRVGIGTLEPAHQLDVRSTTTAVSGLTTNAGALGVKGDAPLGGVLGTATASSINPVLLARAVTGRATAPTGQNYGIWGESASNSGIGVFGFTPATSGNTKGVSGHVNSTQGYAAYFTGSEGSRNYFQRRVGIGTSNPQDLLHVNGITRTSVLTITGGSDLSERFDVAELDGLTPQPGMVVCIDPANPGRLVPSTFAYASTVAGIISGAGGVNTGMLMGQEGSLADGEFPIALTGRVYVLADATAPGSAIVPGDMLTSSDIPGHAMKAVDRDLAYGAVIGKAMTPLAEGERDLVLVLVTLQ